MWIRQLSVCVLLAAAAVQPAAPQAPSPPATLVDPAAMQTRVVNDFINRGHQALNSRDFDTAIALFGRALELAPQNDWALADRGIAYAWKDDAAHARQDLDAAAQINPKNWVVPHGRGLLPRDASG